MAEEIVEEKKEVTPEPKPEEEKKEEVKEEDEEEKKKRAEFEKAAKEIIASMEGKPKEEIKAKLNEAKIPEDIIKELVPEEITPVTEEKEEPKEETKEEPKEEVKEEPKEEVKEEVVEEKKEEGEKSSENLSADVLREQLSVVKQTREELSKVYKEHERLNKESLDFKLKNKELEEKNRVLGLEKESLSNSFNSVKGKLDKIEEDIHMKRLERLSANFKELGQEKSAEQLKVLDKALITEFEGIVKAGLSAKRSAEQLEEPITQPSEASIEEPIKKEDSGEKLNKPFFEHVCNELSVQQGKEGQFNNKRVKNYF